MTTVTINLTSPNWMGIVTGAMSCVVSALNQTPAGAPCRQCIFPTSTIPWDNCGPCENRQPGCMAGQVGMAIRGIYGSNSFPQPDTGPWQNCGPRLQVARMVVSVTRCVPALDITGDPPDCASLFGAALILENDRTAVRQGLACCLSALFHARPPGVGAWALGETTTYDELGGCGGIETEFLVGLPACLCPG